MRQQELKGKSYSQWLVSRGTGTALGCVQSLMLEIDFRFEGMNAAKTQKPKAKS